MSKDATRWKLAAGLCLAGLVWALSPAAASASSITPTDGVDEYNTNPAHCSFREAITAAQTNGTFNGCSMADQDADTIVLTAGATYSLSLPGVDDTNAAGDLDVIGQAGDRTLTISTSEADPALLDVNGATTGDRGIDLFGTNGTNQIDSFSLVNVHITEGAAGAATAGALFERGFVISTSISNSHMYLNSAAGGGAMRLDGVSTTITNSHIDNNTATSYGGIWEENQGLLTINSSTISSNHATGGNGGGLAITNQCPSATLTNSTVADNDATGNGGGIFAQAAFSCGTPGSVTLASTTVAGNHSDFDANGTGDGGGVFNDNSVAPRTVNPRNSIVGDNTDAGNQAPDCSAAITSQGYNLVENATGCTGLTGTGDLTGMDPRLGPLTSANGGVTPTKALLPGSPALNAGNPATPGNPPPACPQYDQRSGLNIDRSVFAPPCDIGSYEVTVPDSDGDKY